MRGKLKHSVVCDKRYGMCIVCSVTNAAARYALGDDALSFAEYSFDDKMQLTDRKKLTEHLRPIVSF